MPAVSNQRDLGAVAKDRRRILGWTQATLASKVGVSRDWVIDLEAGQGNPQLRHLMRALDILGLRLTVEPDRSHRLATLGSRGSAERPTHVGLPVDLDEVLDAHRGRG